MKRSLCVLMALTMAMLLVSIAFADEEYYTDCPCCLGSGRLHVAPVKFSDDSYGKVLKCDYCCFQQVFDPNGNQIQYYSCNWDSGFVTKQPTATETGVKTFSCYACYSVKTEEIPALGGKEEEEPHVHTEEWVPGTPATCTRTGLTDGVKCKWCGKVLEAQKEIPKTDHVYSMWVPNGLGKHYAFCQYNCGYKIDAECQMVQLPIKDASGVAISLCPVCGDCEGVTAAAVKGLKVGEGAPYRGTLRVWNIQADENNKYLAVSFERFGKVMQPEGEVSITLPAELKGTSTGVVGADGNVTSVQESDGTLKLDFSSTQVVVLKGN